MRRPVSAGILPASAPQPPEIDAAEDESGTPNTDYDFALVEHLWLKSLFLWSVSCLETSLLIDSSSVLFVGWKTR